jgi:predicted dehydrogenase
MIMTINAGTIPANHWIQDSQTGGGRIIGEACHFIDLLRFLVGSEIVQYGKSTMDCGFGDTVSIHLEFADGSIGSIHYFANGNKKFPKERLEVFTGGKILQLDNFRVLRGWGFKGFKKMNSWRQDKGQAGEVRAFFKAVENGGPIPIPFDEIVEVSRITLGLAREGTNESGNR